MKRIVMLFFLFGMIRFGNASEDFIVDEVCFKGFYHFASESIISNALIKSGSLISKENVSYIIKSLFLTGNFKDIQIFRDQGVLFIEVKERPIISEITFSGNKLIKTDLLKRNFDRLNIQIGECLIESKLIDIKNKIKEFYYGIGHFNININFVLTSLVDNKISLKLNIFEGSASNIRKINIVGNKLFSKRELLKHFKLKDNISFLDILRIRTKKYQESDLRDDLRALHEFYHKRGYAKFVINAMNISLNSHRNGVYITIYITENEQYTISEVHLNKNLKHYYNEIYKLITIKKGSCFNGIKINQIGSSIQNFFGIHGYPYPEIRTELNINDDEKTIELYFYVNSGRRFYVNQIYFIGNIITKDIVLRRELRQFEGNWLNSELVNLGKIRLIRTGFFNNVDFVVQRVPGTYNQVDIIYKIEERNAGSMKFGIGIGTTSGIGFQFGIYQKNWFGTGNEVGIKAEKNDHSVYTELSFVDPYLSINGISLGGKIFYSNFNSKNANASHYNHKSYGINIFSIFPMGENYSIQIGSSVSNSFLFDIKPQANIFRYFSSLGKKFFFSDKLNYQFNDFILSIGWKYDDLNRDFFPECGNKILLDGKFSIPVFNNFFYKSQFDMISYHALDKNKKWVFLNHIKFSYGNGLNGVELPFYENFYAGGIGSIRGFRSNSIGPKAIYLRRINYSSIGLKPCNPSEDSIGGNAMIIFSLGLTMPTSFITSDESKLIRASLFFDSGTVWDSNWGATPKGWKDGMPNYSKLFNVRCSAGVELQWISPFGPLTISYGKPFKVYKGDKIEEFQFSIG